MRVTLSKSDNRHVLEEYVLIFIDLHSVSSCDVKKSKDIASEFIGHKDSVIYGDE